MAKMQGQESSTQEPEHVEVTAIEPTALEAMERATIDVQITTAKRFPRSIARFTQQAKEMVSVDEETAISCIYRRPVGKKGREIEYAEGESIRFAEIVAACYGNIRVAALITEMTPRYVKATGIAHDLEANYAVKADVMEATVTKDGYPFSERMRVVVAKAAQSKAIRDAIFKVIPKSICKPIIEQSRLIALGKDTTLAQRRKKAAEWIKLLAIEEERVFAALGVEGIEELGDKQLLTLTGIRTAIRDGDARIEDAFPPLDEQVSSGPGIEGLKKRISQRGQPLEPQQSQGPSDGNGDDIANEEPDPETVAKAHAQKEALKQAGGAGHKVPATAGSNLF